MPDGEGVWLMIATLSVVDVASRSGRYTTRAAKGDIKGGQKSLACCRSVDAGRVGVYCEARLARIRNTLRSFCIP